MNTCIHLGNFSWIRCQENMALVYILSRSNLPIFLSVGPSTWDEMLEWSLLDVMPQMHGGLATLKKKHVGVD